MRTGSVIRPVHPKVPREAEATIAPVTRTLCPADRRPDKGEEFIVGRWPNSRLIVASLCSGHGAKFASAIGEKLARLAIDPAYEVEPFFPAIPILCFRLIGPLSLVPRAEACLRAIVDDVQNGRAQCANSSVDGRSLTRRGARYRILGHAY